MPINRWIGPAFGVLVAALPLGAQQPRADHTVSVFAFKDGTACRVVTGTSRLRVAEGATVAWTLVQPPGAAGCGSGLRLDLNDKENRRRKSDGSLDAPGTCSVTGNDQPGSSPAARLRRITKGGLSGSVRCKYTVRVMQGNAEVGNEDPEIEIP